MLQGKFIGLIASTREVEKLKMNDLSLHFKKLETEQKTQRK